MKSILVLFAVIVMNLGIAQAQNGNNNRVSPLDSVSAKVENIDIAVKYSRPFLKGREFGKDIVPYGKVWRTGANEATTFEVSQDCKIEGELLPKGKYSIYSIPGPEETIVIFNKEWDQWGTKYNEKQDALRVKVPTHKAAEKVEQFTIDIDEAGAACMVWGENLFTFHIAPAVEG